MTISPFDRPSADRSAARRGRRSACRRRPSQSHRRGSFTERRVRERVAVVRVVLPVPEPVEAELAGIVARHHGGPRGHGDRRVRLASRPCAPRSMRPESVGSSSRQRSNTSDGVAESHPMTSTLSATDPPRRQPRRASYFATLPERRKRALVATAAPGSARDRPPTSTVSRTVPARVAHEHRQQDAHASEYEIAVESAAPTMPRCRDQQRSPSPRSPRARRRRDDVDLLAVFRLVKLRDRIW